jgi:hypothetical protein
MGLVEGGQRNPSDFHSVIFDAASLTHALVEAGFKDVRPWDWRSTAPHNLIDDYSQAYLPHLSKDAALMSLNLQATLA